MQKLILRVEVVGLALPSICLNQPDHLCRLRKVENKILIAFAIAVGMGIVIGVLTRVLSFDFAVQIVPRTASVEHPQLPND